MPRGDSPGSSEIVPLLTAEHARKRPIVESLADEPANYDEIKRINWGKERPGGDVEALELGPNNCAAT